MRSALQYQQPVGVIGAGKFGTTVAKLISQKANVMLYTRNPDTADQINLTKNHKGVSLPENVHVISNMDKLTAECLLIFPIVPSAKFRSMMKDLSLYLRPEHIMIHGTKGLDIKQEAQGFDYENIGPEDVMTMSEVIIDESSVVRVGCLSGPNIANEIIMGQPTATVVASEFDEVIELGRQVLDSHSFFVFGSKGLKGAELAGAFKNYIAVGSGLLEGHGYGKNIQSLLLTRGLREMIHISQLLGSDVKSFLGTAGIGDLFATATSKDSRNYSFGFRMGAGQSFEEAMSSVDEVAEGVRTLAIANQLSKKTQATTPITQMIYRVVFEGLSIDRAMNMIMRYPFSPDIDYL